MVEDEIGEFGLIEEMPPEAALEPDPAWLEEPALAEPAAEVESEAAEIAEVGDLPEMTLAEPDEIQEIAVAPLDAVHEDTVQETVQEETAEDEIGELGLAEEMSAEATLEPDPAWLEEPARAAC